MSNKIIQKQLFGDARIFIEGVIQEVENRCTDSKGNHRDGDCRVCAKYPKWKRSFVNSAIYYRRYHRDW